MIVIKTHATQQENGQCTGRQYIQGAVPYSQSSAQPQNPQDEFLIPKVMLQRGGLLRRD